jgi:hypothetical protein
MKKLGLFLALAVSIMIIIKIAIGLGDSPERVVDILAHWSWSWTKGGIIAVVLGSIIFFLNHRIRDTRTMSLLAGVAFTVLVPAFLSLLFGTSATWLIVVGAVAGALIGIFTPIIDDHLLDAWEVRHVSLPIFLGLGFGGSVIIATIIETWQDEHMYVTDHAVCTEVLIERYTSHTICRAKGGCSTTYSWDYRKSHYFFAHGDMYPKPVEGKDYQLGTGAFGKKDRIKHAYHKWIGGTKLTKHGEAKGFKWIYLSDNKFAYAVNKTYDVDENYFGHAIREGKEEEADLVDSEIIPSTHTLPTSDNVPGVATMFLEFFKIMATNDDFQVLRWIYALVYLPLLIMAIFIQELRVTFWIFLASSTIVILIILALVVARSGEGLGDLGRRSFGGFGRGRFGGGGSGGRW